MITTKKVFYFLATLAAVVAVTLTQETIVEAGHRLVQQRVVVTKTIKTTTIAESCDVGEDACDVGLSRRERRRARRAIRRADNCDVGYASACDATTVYAACDSSLGHPSVLPRPTQLPYPPVGSAPVPPPQATQPIYEPDRPQINPLGR